MKTVQKFLGLQLEQPKPQAGDAAMVFRASNSAPDRYGDRVFVAGMDLSAWEANPILLYEHDRRQPVGTGKAWKDGDALFVSPVFTRATAKGREVENLVDEGVIRGVSVSFIPKASEPNEHGGLDYLESELLEVSFVSLPANPQALRVKSMNADIRKELTTVAYRLLELLDAEKKAEGDKDPDHRVEQPPGEQPPVDPDKSSAEPPEPKADGGEHDKCPACGADIGSKSAEPPPEPPKAPESGAAKFFAALLSRQ
jgi:HK97 family phage prohead protease